MCSGTINFVDDLLRPRHLHDVLLEQGHEGLPSERVVLHFDGTCGSVLGLALSRDRFGAPADADASVELLLLVRLCDGGEEHRLRDVGLGLLPDPTGGFAARSVGDFLLLCSAEKHRKIFSSMSMRQAHGSFPSLISFSFFPANSWCCFLCSSSSHGRVYFATSRQPLRFASRKMVVALTL